LIDVLNFWIGVSKTFLWVYAISVVLMYGSLRVYYWVIEKEDDTDENVEGNWNLIWTPAINTVGVFFVSYLVLKVLFAKTIWSLQALIENKWNALQFKRRLFGFKSKGE